MASVMRACRRILILGNMFLGQASNTSSNNGKILFAVTSLFRCCTNTQSPASSTVMKLCLLVCCISFLNRGLTKAVKQQRLHTEWQRRGCSQFGICKMHCNLKESDISFSLYGNWEGTRKFIMGCVVRCLKLMTQQKGGLLTVPLIGAFLNFGRSEGSFFLLVSSPFAWPM